MCNIWWKVCHCFLFTHFLNVLWHVGQWTFTQQQQKTCSVLCHEFYGLCLLYLSNTPVILAIFGLACFLSSRLSSRIFSFQQFDLVSSVLTCISPLTSQGLKNIIQYSEGSGGKQMLWILHYFLCPQSLSPPWLYLHSFLIFLIFMSWYELRFISSSDSSPHSGCLSSYMAGQLPLTVNSVVGCFFFFFFF